MSWRLFLRFYQHNLVWGLFAIITGLIIFGIYSFMADYEKYASHEQTSFSILSIVGLSFVFVFSIFSALKLYHICKKTIDCSLDEETLSVKGWAIFSSTSIIINLSILFLIITGSFENIFTNFSQLAVLKEYIGTLQSEHINDTFTTSFNQDLIFRFSFVSFGSGLLLIINYVRKMEIVKQSKKYPGTRALMIFFLLAFLAILSKMASGTEILTDDTSVIISNTVVLTVLFSSIIYFLYHFLAKLKLKI